MDHTAHRHSKRKREQDPSGTQSNKTAVQQPSSSGPSPSDSRPLSTGDSGLHGNASLLKWFKPQEGSAAPSPAAVVTKSEEELYNGDSAWAALLQRAKAGTASVPELDDIRDYTNYLRKHHSENVQKDACGKIVSSVMPCKFKYWKLFLQSEEDRPQLRADETAP